MRKSLYFWILSAVFVPMIAQAGWRGLMDWCEDRLTRLPPELVSLQKQIDSCVVRKIERYSSGRRQSLEYLVMGRISCGEDVLNSEPFVSADPQTYALLLSHVMRHHWSPSRQKTLLSYQSVRSDLYSTSVEGFHLVLTKALAQRNFSSEDLVLLQKALLHFRREKWPEAQRAFIDQVEQKILALMGSKADVRSLMKNWEQVFARRVDSAGNIVIAGTLLEEAQNLAALVESSSLTLGPFRAFLKIFVRDLGRVSPLYFKETLQALSVFRVLCLAQPFDKAQQKEISAEIKEWAKVWVSDEARRRVNDAANEFWEPLDLRAPQIRSVQDGDAS